MVYYSAYALSTLWSNIWLITVANLLNSTYTVYSIHYLLSSAYCCWNAANVVDRYNYRQWEIVYD